ncbi:hypothetical protein F5Y06DRAFT_263999 [Hypoxylon sp. FL0890]|nr:hypothetical protein F5Y06DRAFT_263999 [Hypoxylon sp. FL0890]
MDSHPHELRMEHHLCVSKDAVSRGDSASYHMPQLTTITATSSHFHAPALRITSSNSLRATPFPTPAPPFASRIMSFSSCSSTSCFSVIATRFRCANVRGPSPPPVNNLNASSTSSDAGPLSSLACSLSAQIATNGSYDAYPSSSGSKISRNSLSSGFMGGIPRATMARRTSLTGMTPSFSPSMGSANSAKASLISRSWRAEMLCSLASLDCFSFGSELAAVALRLGGILKFPGSTRLVDRAGKSVQVMTEIDRLVVASKAI